MRYRILGVTQTADDQGTALSIPGARLRALLAALALRPGRTVPPEDLIDDIWTDAPPQDAHAALQALVGRLRRTVGKDGVTSEPGGYRLTATEDDVDLFVFERLVHDGTRALRNGDPRTAARALDDALALWRGPALADLPHRWDLLLPPFRHPTPVPPCSPPRTRPPRSGCARCRRCARRCPRPRCRPRSSPARWTRTARGHDPSRRRRCVAGAGRALPRAPGSARCGPAR
ncbi:AfsR/SARP family transcriptional regulator [Streptomyces galbus]|uniref:OmpR/PhoB-type domain-containing protein n=1 Tax=Streptomyces galbus TaxID=33898 RepID=A0ABX1IPK6_STRGB|nr:hypothetical protein [Streptomyces galbus]